MTLYCSKKLPALLGGDFHCLNCLHSVEAENKRENFIKKLCEKKYFCNVVMPSVDTKTLEFNQ